MQTHEILKRYKLYYEDIKEDRKHIHKRTGTERLADSLNGFIRTIAHVVPHIKHLAIRIGGIMGFALWVIALALAGGALAIWQVMNEMNGYLRDLAHPFLKETTAEWERKYGSADGTDVLAHLRKTALRKPVKRVTRKKQ